MVLMMFPFTSCRVISFLFRPYSARFSFFSFFFFFFNATATTEIYTLSLHDALPISDNRPLLVMRSNLWASGYDVDGTDQTSLGQFSGRVQQTYKHSVPRLDRKSGSAGMPRPISYAVFCLKKKEQQVPDKYHSTKRVTKHSVHLAQTVDD